MRLLEGSVLRGIAHCGPLLRSVICVGTTLDCGILSFVRKMRCNETNNGVLNSIRAPLV